MKISYNWLQKEYFEDSLPTPEEIRKALTLHAFEVESLEKVGDDVVFDIKVLPDRSHDALSHRGIAREISLLCGVSIKKSEFFQEKKFPESNVLRVDIQDATACQRFSTLVIENVEVRESPLWLKKRLEAIGQRSINNIVDVTNYVMFSLGQPLHAYDRDCLKESDGGWKISVRKARNGESVVALDGNQYFLEETDLVITDGNTDSPLGIAGVKGGKQSEISKNTKNIILEAANFDSVLIRTTAKRLGLRTDASVRFENAITPELTMAALDMATSLIFSVAQGDTQDKHLHAEGACDVYPRRPSLYKVGVSLSEIENILGVGLQNKQVEDILKRRGYEWSYVKPREIIASLAETLIDAPYKYGASVVYDSPKTFDCSSLSSFLYAQAGIAIPRVSIEQFLFGEEVQENDLMPGDLVFAKGAKPYFFKEEPRGVGHVGIYIGNGEIIHAAGSAHGNRVRKEKLKESSSFDGDSFRGFRRLIRNEEGRFVVTVPAERLDLRIKEDLIEEIGRIYGYENLKSKAISLPETILEIHKKTYYEGLVRKFFAERGFSEVITYAFQGTGDIEIQNPIAGDKSFLRSSLAIGLNSALEINSKNIDLLGLSQIRLFEIGNIFKKNDEYTALGFGMRDHKGTAILNIEELVSELSKLLQAPINFSEVDGIFELNFTKLLESLETPVECLRYEKSLDDVKYKEYSRYPAIFRDIAVFIPESADSEQIIEVVKREAGLLLVNYRLFDVFTKEFSEGKKTSYAYKLVFQSMEKTLSDDEINPIMDRITKTLNEKAGWNVR